MRLDIDGRTRNPAWMWGSDRDRTGVALVRGRHDGSSTRQTEELWRVPLSEGATSSGECVARQRASL